MDLKPLALGAAGRDQPNFIQGNAPYAITRGAQFSFFGPLFEGFNLSGGLIYDDAHFNNGFDVECLTGAACPALHQLPYAPKLKATIAGDYHHRLVEGVDGFLQSDLAYSGPYPYASTPGFPGSPARYLIGARAGAQFDKGKWSIAVFCRNCLDKRYPIDVAPDGFDSYDGGIVGSKYPIYEFLTIDSYRVVGVTLDAKY